MSDSSLLDQIAPRLKSPGWLAIPLGAIGVVLGLLILSLFPVYLWDFVQGRATFNGDDGALLCFAVFGGLLFLGPSAWVLRDGLRPASRHPAYLLLRDRPASVRHVRPIDYSRRGKVVGFHIELVDDAGSTHLIFCDDETERKDLLAKLRSHCALA